MLFIIVGMVVFIVLANPKGTTRLLAKTGAPGFVIGFCYALLLCASVASILYGMHLTHLLP